MQSFSFLHLLICIVRSFITSHPHKLKLCSLYRKQNWLVHLSSLRVQVLHSSSPIGYNATQSQKQNWLVHLSGLRVRVIRSIGYNAMQFRKQNWLVFLSSLQVWVVHSLSCARFATQYLTTIKKNKLHIINCMLLLYVGIFLYQSYFS